jgi:O-antigen ligase
MIGADEPFFLFCATTVATCVILVLTRLALRSPRYAVASCYIIVLAAATKLRQRDSSASLSGDLDFQILIELSLYAVLGFLVALAALVRWRTLKPFTPAETVLFGYVLLTLVSTAWSFAPSFTAIRALQLFILFGLASVSVRILGSDQTIRVASTSLILYVVFCVGAVTAGLPLAGGYTETDFLGFSRFTWFALHPITAATLAALAGLSLVASAVASSSGWSHRRFGIPVWLYTGFLFVTLVVTYSRGPLLAFLAAAGVLVLKTMRGGKALLLAATATVLIVATLAASNRAWSDLVTSGNPITRTLFRGQNPDQLVGLTGRVALWEAAIPLFLERPAVGYGYHGSRPILLAYASWAGYAHNGFLQTLLDLGIVGALLVWPAVGWLVLTGLFRPFHHSDRTAAQEAFVLGTAVFLLLNSLTSEGFTGTPGYEVLLLFACTSVASHLHRTEAAVKPLSAFTQSAVWRPPVHRSLTAPPIGAGRRESSHRP